MHCSRTNVLFSSLRGFIAWLTLSLMTLGFSAPAAGQTFFNWNGLGGNDFWSTPGNWDGGIAPTSGTDFALSFPFRAGNYNMFNDYTNPCFNRLDFNDEGYTLSGNSIILEQTTGGILPAVSGNLNTTIFTDWILNDDLTYTAGAGATSFVYNGAISGSSALNLYGAFTLGSGGQLNNTGAINITTNSGTVTIDGNIGGGGLMTIDNSRTLAGTGTINRNILMSGAADITSTGTLTVNGDVTITNAPNNLLAGTLSVNGLMEINGGLLQQSAGSVLSGSGNLLITGGGSAAFNGTVAATKEIELAGILFPVFIYGDGTLDANVIVNGDHIVGLNGSLTLNGNTLFSSSVVQAQLGHSSGSLTNNGIVVVDNTGIVRLEGDVQSTSFGSIGVDPGGHLLLTGNTLDTNSSLFNGGTVTVGAASTIGGSFGLEDGGILELNGQTLNAELAFLSEGTTSIINGGTITVGGFGLNVQSGALTVDTGVVINSSGSAGLTIDAGASLIANGAVNLDTLVRGTLNGGAGSLINNALTTENALLTGVLDIQNTLTVQSTGLTELQAGANLTVAGLTTVRQGGLIVSDLAQITAAGNINVVENSQLNVNGTLITDLMSMDHTTLLQGNGLILGDMTLNGMLSPGNSAGRLKVEGTITLNTSATVCIEIGGTGDENLDILDGRGNSTLSLSGARLELMLIDGFVPTSTQEFQFLRDFSELTGTFGNGDSLRDSGTRISFYGGSFEIVYETNSILLRDFQPVPEPSSLLLSSLVLMLTGKRKRRINFAKTVNEVESLTKLKPHAP